MPNRPAAVIQFPGAAEKQDARQAAHEKLNDACFALAAALRQPAIAQLLADLRDAGFSRYEDDGELIEVALSRAELAAKYVDHG